MILEGQLASREDVIRFRAEAEAAARLDHPHIVPIHEVGEREGRHYFSMKYIEGRTLADMIGREREFLRLPSGQTWSASLLAKVARAVHFAHQHGILHRDLKPGNILLETHGSHTSGATPYVTDFGLAKSLEADSQITRTGEIVGTPSYMAPEQAAGNKNLSTAVDIYSLGAILYHLITGRRPFQEDTPMATLLKVQTEDPALPRSLDQAVARDLEVIAMKCLQKNPRHRYASAEALAEDLERWLRGEPILARPARWWEGPIKWARRRPAIFALSCAVVLMGLVAVGLMVAQWRAEVHHRRQLQEAEASAQLNAYVSRIALAANEISAGRVAGAMQSLDLCPESWRGWEWNYLANLAGKPIVTTRSAGQARFFADGSRVVLNDSESAVVVDQQGRRLLEPPGWHGLPSPDGHFIAVDEGTQCFRVIRVHDGKCLAIHKADSAQWRPGTSILALHENHFPPGEQKATDKITLWNAATEKTLHTLQGTNPVFSPDGKRLALGETIHRAGKKLPEHKLTIFDAVSGEPIHSLPAISAIHGFTADGERVFATSDKSVVLWDLAKGAELGRLEGTLAQYVLSGESNLIAVLGIPHEPRVSVWRALPPVKLKESQFACLVSPDGRFVAEYGDPGLSLWRLDADRADLASKLSFVSVKGAAFSQDGKTLAALTANGWIELWNLDTLTHKGRILVGENHVALQLSPDGRLAVAASIDDETKVWDVTSNLRFGPNLSDAAFCGACLISVSEVGKVECWDPRRRKRLSESEQAVSYTCCASAPNQGFFLACALGETCLVQKWTVDPLGVQRQVVSESNPCAVAIDPTGKRFALGCQDGTVSLWDSTSLEMVHSSSAHKAPARRVAFHPKSGEIIAVYSDGLVRVGSADAQRVVREFQGGAGTVVSLAVSPDGRWLVQGGEDNRIRIWDWESGELLHDIPQDKPISQLAFTSDGTRLAVATGLLANIVVKVFETRRFHQVITLPADTVWASSLAFDPNDRWLMLAEPRGFQLWDGGKPSRR